jgi:predicted nucleotidyltransferase
MANAGAPSVEGVDVDGMRRYLDETAVIFAVLFGSRAKGTADDASDVDVALGFPDEMDSRDRFRARNRIDATLQEYADGFVDVSDIESLPTHVARAALRDGVLITGDERLVETHREELARELEATASERERERREFIDRLDRGDT